MPIPNVIAGVLIGIANESWRAVVMVSCIWGLVWCMTAWILEPTRAFESIRVFRERGQKLLFRSPFVTFWVVEWFTAAVTATVVGTVTHFSATLF